MGVIFSSSLASKHTVKLLPDVARKMTQGKFNYKSATTTFKAGVAIVRKQAKITMGALPLIGSATLLLKILLKGLYIPVENENFKRVVQVKNSWEAFDLKEHMVWV